MSFIQKAVLKGRLFGAVETRNIFYAQVSPTSLDTFQILWEGYLDAIFANITTIISTGWVASAIQVFEWQSPDWVPMDEINYTQAGAATGDALPNLVSAVIVGKVPFQRGFGRKFFSGMVESMCAGDALISNALIALGGAALAYVSVYFGSNSGVLGPGIFKKDNTFHAFSQGFASSLLGTMRRRKPGLGI